MGEANTSPCTHGRHQHRVGSMWETERLTKVRLLLFHGQDSLITELSVT